MGNAIGDSLRAKVYPASAESAPFVSSNRQERGPCNSLSFTQERRDMDLFVLTGIVELIHIVELHCPL